MIKIIIKLTVIILIALVLCGFELSSKAEGTSGKNFILPKTFKINDEFLPPLDAKPNLPQNKTVSTEPTPIKVIKPNAVITSTSNPKVQTVKTNSVTTSTQTKNKIPVVYKQPDAVITTNPAKNNNVKSTVIQTNPIKTNTINKSGNATSITNLIKNYESSYADTLKSTIIALSAMGIIPESYNTEKGQIIAKLPSGKEIFILLVPFKEDTTCVRITPTDGNYNISLYTINEIFSNIKENLPAN
ncbi:MAG TPA: hypothetical protein DDW90_00075 [Cyanobacteria bacterium UBA9971]|nr:hypothetical protein [Cyanobacteria bacterium UBA9971]